MIRMKKFNEGVYYTSDAVTKIDREDIEFLKKKAAVNRRKRARFCFHKSADDVVHEMMIAIARGSYFGPHRHRGKSESFHVIEGRLKVVMFDESGKVKDVITLGDYHSGEKFYYRLAEDLFHTVILASGVAVFHETTRGPFRRNEDTQFAPWAPQDDDCKNKTAYLRELNATVETFLRKAKTAR